MYEYEHRSVIGFMSVVTGIFSHHLFHPQTMSSALTVSGGSMKMQPTGTSSSARSRPPVCPTRARQAMSRSLLLAHRYTHDQTPLMSCMCTQQFAF